MGIHCWSALGQGKEVNLVNLVNFANEFPLVYAN